MTSFMDHFVSKLRPHLKKKLLERGWPTDRISKPSILIGSVYCRSAFHTAKKLTIVRTPDEVPNLQIWHLYHFLTEQNTPYFPFFNTQETKGKREPKLNLRRISPEGYCPAQLGTDQCTICEISRSLLSDGSYFVNRRAGYTGGLSHPSKP